MKKASVLLAITLLGILVAGASDRSPGSAFDVTAIRKVVAEKNNQFTKAHVTREVAIINNYFTRDAKIFLPNADIVTGSAAIAELNREYVKLGITEFREETTALYGNEDYLIEEGKYSMTFGKPSVLENGKYLNIWKKEDGDWKVFSNIWNSSMPATP